MFATMMVLKMIWNCRRAEPACRAGPCRSRGGTGSCQWRRQGDSARKGRAGVEERFPCLSRAKRSLGLTTCHLFHTKRRPRHPARVLYGACSYVLLRRCAGIERVRAAGRWSGWGGRNGREREVGGGAGSTREREREGGRGA